MNFHSHSNLKDKHAFLSPSKYHWVNYDDQKLEARYASYRAAALGSRLHDFAQDAIDLGVTLPRTKATLHTYVNDAIKFRMETEQPLFYSPNCFGHADAISFRKGVLRIHDLKTGITPTSFGQLKVYAAIFCLEYGVNPEDIQTILRIYQNNEIREEEPYPDEIEKIMDKIVYFDQKIEALKEAEW